MCIVHEPRLQFTIFRHYWPTGALWYTSAGQAKDGHRNSAKGYMSLGTVGLSCGSRQALSGYPIDPGKPCENCLWIITEEHRSVITFLLPGEH